MESINHDILNDIFKPLKSKLRQSVPKDKAEFTGPISIKNGENKISFSSSNNSIVLSLNNNTLEFTNEGKLKINNIELEKGKGIDYDEVVESGYIIKPSNHSIYTSNNNSYTNKDASFISINDDEYYTEYNDNNIVKNTATISTSGITKMYIKTGAKINGKEVPCESEGWQDINILDYM